MEPLDNLAPLAQQWVNDQGSTATTVSQILESRDEAIFLGIQKGIDKANKDAVARVQKIQKWTVLPKDFSIPGGELGKFNGLIVMKPFCFHLTSDFSHFMKNTPIGWKYFIFVNSGILLTFDVNPLDYYYIFRHYIVFKP